MADLPPKLFFRIGEVAGLVGVEPHVLRYWEREFRSIRPTKSAKGQRVYSRKDVENLLRVRDLLYRDGFTIAGAKKKLQRPPVEGASSVAYAGADARDHDDDTEGARAAALESETEPESDAAHDRGGDVEDLADTSRDSESEGASGLAHARGSAAEPLGSSFSDPRPRPHPGPQAHTRTPVPASGDQDAEAKVGTMRAQLGALRQEIEAYLAELSSNPRR